MNAGRRLFSLVWQAVSSDDEHITARQCVDFNVCKPLKLWNFQIIVTQSFNLTFFSSFILMFTL